MLHPGYGEKPKRSYSLLAQLLRHLFVPICTECEAPRGTHFEGCPHARTDHGRVLR